MSQIVVAAEEELLSQGPAAAGPRQEAAHPGRLGRPRRRARSRDFLDAKALVAFTKSGDTARRLSRYRAPQPVMAFTTDESTRNQLGAELGRGVHVVPHVNTTDAMVEHGRRRRC